MASDRPQMPRGTCGSMVAGLAIFCAACSAPGLPTDGGACSVPSSDQPFTAGDNLCASTCFGSDFNQCEQAVCPACSYADGEILNGDAGLALWRCEPTTTCTLPSEVCLAEEARRLLSPSCAAVLTSALEQQVLTAIGDGGGSACGSWPRPNGADFCSAISGCIGDAGICEQVVCSACNATDGVFLGGAAPVAYLGGLCPAVDSASPCASFACLLDAGPRILSPSCAAAVAALAGSFFDAG